MHTAYILWTYYGTAIIIHVYEYTHVIIRIYRYSFRCFPRSRVAQGGAGGSTDFVVAAVWGRGTNTSLKVYQSYSSIASMRFFYPHEMQCTIGVAEGINDIYMNIISMHARWKRPFSYWSRLIAATHLTYENIPNIIQRRGMHITCTEDVWHSVHGNKLV